MEIRWSCKPFDQLTPHELYAILLLRSQVFVVEQQCVFLDMDSKDQRTHHLMAWHNDELIGYTRLLAPGISFPEAAIGRVVTAPPVRGTGFGHTLMARSIEELFTLFGEQAIRIGAQYHLKRFYEKFGFVQAGEVYDEDGIDHVEMLRQGPI